MEEKKAIATLLTSLWGHCGIKKKKRFTSTFTFTFTFTCLLFMNLISQVGLENFDLTSDYYSREYIIFSEALIADSELSEDEK